MELYFAGRKEWRQWLEKHHSTDQPVWLVYYKKASGKTGISYDESVEEALCFGWIDGKIRKVNDEYYVRRFSIRRPGSKWSVINFNRAERMITEGRMTQAGLGMFQKALEKPDLVYKSFRKDEVKMPGDLSNALSLNKKANNNFLNLSPSKKRLLILWLINAKREETRMKRIDRILEFSEKNDFPSML